MSHSVPPLVLHQTVGLMTYAFPELAQLLCDGESLLFRKEPIPHGWRMEIQGHYGSHYMGLTLIARFQCVCSFLPKKHKVKCHLLSLSHSAMGGLSRKCKKYRTNAEGSCFHLANVRHVKMSPKYIYYICIS